MVNWKTPHELINLTHLDGRNAAKLFTLRPYFSELAWMKERIGVMVAYATAIAPHLEVKLSVLQKKNLTKLYTDFSLTDARRVVKLEKTLNHDLKALEAYVARKLPTKRISMFGIGSEDINNIAFGRLLLKSREEVLLPELGKVLDRIKDLAVKEKNVLMVARTHAQPAGITTFGKELTNPLLRLCDEIEIWKNLTLQGKASGELGNFFSLSASKARVDWLHFADRFVVSQGLEPQHGATQIAPYDSWMRYLQSMGRINAVLLDLCKNMWLYVLLGYVRVVKKEKEVGSAGIPHKVNPIYFEGAEGGLTMANGIIETLARTLMINRLQRDFSDSTVRRNISLVFAYSLLSYQSLIEAFGRIEVNEERLAADIQAHAEVWIEAIKIRMIEEGRTDAYEVLKKHTRGQTFTHEQLHELLVKNNLKKYLPKDWKNPYPSRIVEEGVVRVRKLKLL